MKTMSIRRKRGARRDRSGETPEAKADASVTEELAAVDVPRAPGNRRGWNDRAVKGMLVLAIALGAFAAGRFTVHQGPRTLAEALEQARSGDLPQGTMTGGGAGGFPGGGAGGFPGGGAGAPGGASPGAATGARSSGSSR